MGIEGLFYSAIAEEFILLLILVLTTNCSSVLRYILVK
jgi:hypothetical protein